MTSPDNSPSPQPEPEPEPRPVYADRVYRSGASLVGGALLLAIAAWLGIDAMIRGDGRIPWYALAGLLFATPLVVAFTLRPAVFAGEDRLRVRNPFRTITLPWGAVDAVRAGYSSEVLADDRKYQMWAIPVSLRERKKAARQRARGAAGGAAGRRTRMNPLSAAAGAADGPQRAAADTAVAELRELAERNAGRETAQGVPSVSWAYEILAPAGAGLALLILLSVLG